MNFTTFISLAMIAMTVSAFVSPPPSTFHTQTPSGSTLRAVPVSVKSVTAATTAALAVGVTAKKFLDKGSRKYTEDSVATEYDAWTQDGILEYYWGEHIHLGYYNSEEMAAGYKKKNFIEAKYDFTREMMSFGGMDKELIGQDNLKVLDVGCGVGGTTRFIAKQLTGKNTEVRGITLSPNQVKRAQELAAEQNVKNAKFEVMDALKMDFPDNSFDVVWGCESGEHMPSKEKYIEEMIRVLKPGGKFIMATWCQRDDRKIPFDERDKRDLKFLYEEWTHPLFISIEKYAEILESTNVVSGVHTEDWNEQTIASWRHSIWVGVYDPRGFIFKPRQYLKCARDAYCLERMHRAFDRGLMQYGMFRAVKKADKIMGEAGGKEGEELKGEE